MGILLALYLVLVLAVVPLIAWRTAGGDQLLAYPRPVLYRASISSAWLLAGLGLVVLLVDPTLTPARAGLTMPPAPALAGATAATVAVLGAGLALVAHLRRAASRPESRCLAHLLPRSADERRWFAGVAVTAGITEEFIYRGVALPGLAAVLPVESAPAGWLAAVIVAAIFGAGHAYQDTFGVLRAGVSGVVLAVPYLLGGSLLPGIVAHTLIDLSLLTRAGRRLLDLHQPAAAGGGATRV
ncbi:MAG: CPBP family intramembrane glutamic endopeptidase [Acidobacteriota bacterium]